jgi:hypothetical protein
MRRPPGYFLRFLRFLRNNLSAEIVRYERLDEITPHKPIITIPIPI